MEAQIKHYQNKLAYEIDPADVADFFRNEMNGRKMIVIDARTSNAFKEEHIPGAISFPHRTMNPETIKTLDRSATYVTYCDGIGCNASTKGALKLAEFGFMVKELIGGLEWWKRDGFSTEGYAATKGNLTVKCAC